MIASAPVLVIIADDLTGAVETAGAVAVVSSSPAQVWLGPPPSFDAAVIAVDTASRGLGDVVTEEKLNAVLDIVPDGVRIYKKIDSLLRGEIAAEVRALRARGYPVMVATAAPRIGRTVHAGVVHIDGTPLHESRLWRAAEGLAPSSIVEAIGAPCRVLPVDVVRSVGLRDAIRTAADVGLVPVCDTETEADLELVAGAVAVLDPRLVTVGSAGLARALASHLDLVAVERPFVSPAERVITVVGTVAAAVSEQIARLVAEGTTSLQLDPGRRPQLDGGDAVVRIAEDSWEDAAFLALADSIRDLPGRTDLVVTGGDTARRMLDALRIESLCPEQEIHYGAVLSTTDGGMTVVTRPGSYGSGDSLVQIVRALKGEFR